MKPETMWIPSSSTKQSCLSQTEMRSLTLRVNQSTLQLSLPLSLHNRPLPYTLFFLPFPKRLVFSDNPFFGGGENEDDEEIEAGY